MKTALMVLMAMFLAVAAHAQCGSDKITQKDLCDADTSFLSLLPVHSTVAQEGALPVTAPRRLVTLTAIIYAYKCEADQDFHAAIRDGNATMIAEFPNPDCPDVKRSSRYAQMKVVRAWFIANVGTPTAKMKKCNVAVTLTGVRFFDTPHHNGFGHAGNEVEIHPCLSMSK